MEPAPRSKTGVYRFNLKEVRRWRAENLSPRPGRTDTLTDARRRKENALAGLRELELRKREGELVERSAVEKKTFELARRARDGYLNLPSRVSGILAAETDQEKIFALLTTEIHQILVELSGQHDQRTTIST